MSCLDWIAATGSLIAATGASVAAWHAVKLLKLEKKREGERDAEQKKAKLVATIERELVRNAEWRYLLRIRNYGEAEARDIEVEVVSIRQGEQEVTYAVTDLRNRLKIWDVRCLGPGGSFDLPALTNTYAMTIELRVRWQDASGSPGEYHTQLCQGQKPVG